MICPCNSGEKYAKCCEPILSGHTQASTAEKLMRARYTAYTQANMSFIKKTITPEGRKDFDENSAKKWALESKWKGLKILSTEKGTEGDTKGRVEFIATYEQNGEGVDHHEVAQFRKNKDGEWLFSDSESHTHKEGEGHSHAKPQTVIRESPKVGRNDPCSCGSGKKYKKCCGA